MILVSVNCTVFFQTFLGELHNSGKITSLSLWKDSYSFISEDERYQNMLGQPGEWLTYRLAYKQISLHNRYTL